MGATAEARIYDAGGHFVLCQPTKRPLWKAWQKRRPTPDVAAIHRAEDGPLGIIPWSLRSSALDVDHGDPRNLFEHYDPWVALPSRRGRHAYYDDNTPRGNGTWEALGCRGDVRGAKGYLVFHGDGVEQLAAALAHRVPGASPFPRDLFDVGLGGDLVVAGAAAATAPPLRRADPLPIREGEAVNLPLETVLPGGRHIAHFNQVRWWAYSQERGDDLTGWLARVESYALRQNHRFPVPVTEADARDMSRSVAKWIWSGGGSFDHSYVAQSRRGQASGKVRRHLTLDRDRFIVSRLNAGDPQRAVARAFGVYLSTVQGARARLSRPRRAPKGVALNQRR